MANNASVSTPERLVYWYLRLNGFMLLENFVIHPDTGDQQRTEADLLGVRFNHRRELLINPMKDEPRVSECSTFCNVVITEVKRSQCALNGPWTTPGDQNMHRILRAIGCFEARIIPEAADALYNEGRYQNDYVTCRLLAFGDSQGDIPIRNVPQILFDDVIKFIHSRFRSYLRQKASVGNWHEDGRLLKELAVKLSDSQTFKRDARRLFGIA